MKQGKFEMKMVMMRFIVQVTMYFRSYFLESCKTIHFWKLYGLLNPNNNVYIFSKQVVAAVLEIQSGDYFFLIFGYISTSKRPGLLILVSKYTFSGVGGPMEPFGVHYIQRRTLIHG